MRLERTFHPVGHGAFYTERFYDEHNQNVANIVFDCGRYETAKESWCYQSYKTWIEDYVKNHSWLVKDDVIDILFISHFHTDHIIGIDSLLKYCDVKKIVIPAIDTLTVFQVHQGVCFLGVVVKPYCRFMKLSGVSRVRRHIAGVLTDGQNPYAIRAVLESYSGYGRHFTPLLQKNRLVFL